MNKLEEIVSLNIELASLQTKMRLMVDEALASVRHKIPNKTGAVGVTNTIIRRIYKVERLPADFTVVYEPMFSVKTEPPVAFIRDYLASDEFNEIMQQAVSKDYNFLAALLPIGKYDEVMEITVVVTKVVK